MKKIILFVAIIIAFVIHSKAQVSVTATAGTAGPTSYSTLKLAFDAINVGTHQGAVTVSITANTTEGTTPATLNSSGAGSASYTSVLVRPTADGVSISGNPASGFGVIQLKGADNVTIDGDNPNTAGTNRNLTVSNTTTTTVIANSVIRIATSTAVTSADNNTISNCILLGNVTAGNSSSITSASGSSNSSFGIYCGGNGGTTAIDAPTAITSVTTQTAPSGTTINGLTINNNAISQCARAIVFNGSSASSSTGVTISNNLVGATATLTGIAPYTSPSTTVYTKGIWINGTNAITISGNTLQNIISYVNTSIIAIELSGAIGSGTISISSNTINGVSQNGNNASKYGAVLVSSAGGAYSVTNNTISNIDGFNTTNTSASAGAVGIDVATAATSATISGNRITKIYNRGNGYAARGIVLNGGNNISVQNNFISDILNVGNASFSLTYGALGILANGGIGHKIYHNSVNLYGTNSGSGSNLTACFGILATSQTGIDVRNNIFSNTMATSVASNANVCLYLPSGGTSTMNLTLNNNSYYSGSTAGVHGVCHAGATYTNPNTATAGLWTVANFAAGATTPATNLRAYTSTLSAAGTNDNASNAFTTVAPFKSSTDLHIDTTLTASAINLFQNGVSTSTTSVTQDIDLETRNTLPCRGADEFRLPVCTGAPSPGTITAAASPICSGGSTTLSLSGTSSGVGITYQWKTASVLAGPYTNMGTSSTQATGVLTATTYYKCIITCTTSSSVDSTAVFTLTVNPIPTVSVTRSATQYCGNTPVTLTASGATTYTWSAITDLFTNAAGTTAYTALANANPVYSKASANITYTVVGTSSGCTASNTVTVNKGTFVTISSVTAQSPSACAGGTDSITVVASVPSTASSYAFSSGTGASFLTIPSPTTLTTVVNGSVDDGSNPVTPSPTFSFPFAGVNYTDFNVNTNGWMKMLTAAPATNIPSSLTSIGSTTGIFMFGRDANLNTANGGSITHGAAAGGKYVIQFNNNSGGGGGVASATSYVNAQIVLWGSTSSSPGKIEIIYGTSIGTPGSNGTIGIVDIANTYMNAVTGNSIATTTVSTWPASGTMYTFTPPTLTYTWTSLNPSNTLIDNTLRTAVATVNATGKYQIVVSETGGCSALDSSLTVTLGGGVPTDTISAIPVATVAAKVCPGTSVTLSNTGLIGGCSPFTHKWNTGATTTTLTISPTVTTTYYDTITDASSQVVIGSYTVNVHPIVTASISPSTATVCGTSPVTLTASGGTIYRWSVNGSAAVTGLFTTTAATTAYTAGANQNPMYARPVSATTYAVTVTDANTCTASTTRTIAVGSPVTITSVTPQTLSACSGGTDSITVVASVAAPVSSYVFASSTGASLDPMTGATVYFGSGIDNAAGSYTLTTFPSGFVFPYEGVNQTQFTASDNGVLRLGSTAVNTTQYGSITGQSLLLSVAGADMGSGSDGGVSYLLTGTAPNRVFILQYRLRHTWSTTLAINNTFQVWLYETSGKIEYRYGTMGSSGTPAHGIGLSGATTTNYQSVAVSTGLSSTSTITSNTTLPASGTMYSFTPPTLTYAWTSLNPSNTLINTTLPTTVATITDTGKFQIVVTEAGGCSALDSTVKIFLGGGNPNITAMNTTNNSYCYTDSTILSTTVLGGCPPYTYSWSGGLGSTASVKAKPTTTTKYYVTVTDNNTNVDIDSITVTIISPQILTVLGDTICGTDTARLSATANAGDSIVWYRSATGTNIVKFGANLDTVLSANDTFYVGATVITGTNTYNVGPPARVAALNYFISNNWGITFNASEPCVINSVAIYPSTAGIISIRAQSSMTTPTIFGTYSMNITAGQIGTKVIVPVNFVIPTAGTGYKMIVEAATTVTGLHRETPPAPGFAYSTVGSPISLPSSEWGGTTTGTYYFFYDWSVTKTTYCQSSRTPVVVVRNTPPTISATAPTFVCIGESVALNVTSPNDPNYTYTWNPGSLSGASQTVTPGSTTTYTVNAFDATTGCRASKDTIVVVRPYPTKPILNVDSVYLCNGTVQPLNITNGFNSGTASATSGTISLAIPDNSATGISSILNLSTVPTGATIDSVAVTFNLNHAYLADAEVTLTAPNGKVIALAADQGPSGTGSYVNTRISSNNANPVLSTTSTPISGTYRANATVAGSLKGSFGANLTSTFSDLFTTANGNWTLTAFDDDATDLGTLTSYSIDIYYRNTTSYSWTPISSLYTNVTTTTGYTSGDSITVYAKPTASTDYIVTATLNGCSTSDTAKYVIKSSSSSIALFSASTNGSPLTLDCEDAGWTYYADPSNNNRWLFGIDWDTNLVAKSTAQIALDYNTSGVIKDVKQRPGSSADYDGAYIMRRYWNVNNATLNAGSTPVKIRFFYDPADTTAARDSMDINRVAYATASPGGNPYYATPWKWFKTVGVAFTPALINDGNNFSFSNIELTPSAMSTLNGVSYVQFDNITSFSGGSGGIGFTPHSGGVGLPVTLVSFAGNVEEAHNHIQWTTASELNNDHFELESSVDGKNFTTLATISGHGTTTETHQYSFNDYKYNMPSTYYRLKQVDFDGKSTTTNMIILTRMSNASTSAVVSVYPNPTNDITTLSIDVQENAEATYTIHDITGKIVSEGAINCIAGMNNTTIQTGDLADGMYIVDVLINGKHINTRLVKSTK